MRKTSRILPKNATKNHIGYNLMFDRLKKRGKSHSSQFNTLIVYGHLHKSIMPYMWKTEILLEHPVDKGYFKKTIGLSPRGKEVLKQKRKVEQNEKSS